MLLTRRSRIVLAIAGSTLTLAAAAPRALSPGYTYRLKMTSHVTEPNGKTSESVVMSGEAKVNANGGRLDIEESSREKGAMVEKGGYILYDATSMMLVSPRDKQVIRFGFDDLGKGMAQLTNVPGMKIQVTDVKVGFEKLGAGEPMLGMATTRYRLTQEYRLAVKVAFMNRSSTERVEQEYWMADQKHGLANPFSKMGGAMKLGGGGFDELINKTTEASKQLGKGIALKTVTTTVSTSSKNEKTLSVGTMLITDLKAGNVDDALLRAPSDYTVTDMGEQFKAMGAQMDQARAAQAAEAAQAGAPNAVPDSTPSMKEAAADAAKNAAKQAAGEKLKRGLGGMLRRP